ncbi:hypothetical protein U1Q18_046709 [Sarracenia purpurea var. burkii]
MANTNQSKDDHCKEKPATDPDQPPLLPFRNSSRTRSRGWDSTSPVRSGGSGKVSATLGLLATSGIWEIASRSDLGARRRAWLLIAGYDLVTGRRSWCAGGGVLTWLGLSVSSPFFTAFLMVEEINFTLSDGATGGVFDFEEFLRCAVCLSQIPKNSISVLRLSRVALEIGGRSGILRNGAAPLAAVAFADDCGLSVEKIRALSRPSL